jgi:hypothetical protein
MSKKDESDKKKNNKKTVIPASSVQKLSNLRIIQKHLVYVIGLSSTLSNKDVNIINFRFYTNMNTLVNMVIY